MQIPKWVKSFATLLSRRDRLLSLPQVAVGATIASLSASGVAAQTKAHAEDIHNPTDSGFTKKNEKYLLTAADSFVIRKRDTVRFGREVADPVSQAAPNPTYVAPPSRGGTSSGHYSHSSHASHSSHRSGGM
jgi:hypothetical protein